MTITLSDALAINDRRTTGDGYLVASARAARTGVQVYGGAEVGKPEMAVVRVYRPPEEVFSGDSLSTYANKPITLGHPPAGVTAATWKQHAVGHVDNGIVPDGQFVRVSMMIADAAAIGDLNNGTRELSAGYTCDLEWTAGTAPDGQTFDAIQRRVRINHVALVPRGRAGSDCRIGDSAPPSTTETRGVPNMNITDAQIAFTDHLPNDQSARIREIIADCSSNELFRVQKGRKSAMDMSWALGANASPHASYLFTDAQRGANQTGYEFLHSLAGAAAARENHLRMAWAGGDDSVDIGVSRTASHDAREKYKQDLSDAWKGPPVGGALAQAQDASNPAATDSRSAYEQMCAEQSNAWKMGK